MAKAAVRSKAVVFGVVDLLINSPIVCGSSVFIFVLLCITLCPF